MSSVPKVAMGKLQKLINGVLAGQRTSLSRAITLVESTSKRHNKAAQKLIESVLQAREDNTSAKSFRLGIAGPPGAGKSTFIESLGMFLTNKGHKVAVLAVDPSSSITKGSILGDKTRMPDLSRSDSAFVRPSPTNCILGGIAQHTNEVVLLCEAAGYDVVLVESVGLGQSETVLDEAVDMMMLMVPPGGGDELQGSKKGIMEVSDLIVVNKADGNLKSAAQHTKVEYKRASQLIQRRHPAWKPQVRMISALEKNGIDVVWDTVCDYREIMEDNGQIMHKREVQSSNWMWSSFQEQVIRDAKGNSSVRDLAAQLEQDLKLGNDFPRAAASKLLDEYLSVVRRNATEN